MAIAKRSSNNNKKQQPIGNRLSYYMKAPYRALITARDLYVSSLGGCAGRVQQGRAIPSIRVPRSQSHGFFRRREENDVAELLRAASQGRLARLGIRLTSDAAVPRSQSAGVGASTLPMMIERIEEEGASDLEGSSRGGSSYPRSRSCAVVPNGRALNGMAAIAA